MSVIDFNEAKAARTPHLSGEFFCLGCLHGWSGVAPLGATDLECPSCHAHMGRSKFEVSPQENALVYTCRCENQFFNVLADRIHCPACGNQTLWENLK